jgi:lysophospholipase L1-like esterase
MSDFAASPCPQTMHAGTYGVKSFAQAVVMFIGSSMVQYSFSVHQQGFAIALADWWQRLADIVVRGQGGYNSRWILQGLPSIIGTHRPDLTILWIGNNDSYLPTTTEQCDADSSSVTATPPPISTDEYEKNMREIISQLRQINSEMAIILLTPTRSRRPDRSDEYTEAYVNVVFRLGSEGQKRLYVLDLFSHDSPWKIVHEGESIYY